MIKPSSFAIDETLLRFHGRVGIRVGLRLLASVLVVLFASYYLLRPEFFSMIADFVFARTSPLGRGTFLALILLPAAETVARRVGFGLGGWLRHLPASSPRHRRMAALAVVIALTPLLAVLGGLAALGAGKNGPPEIALAAVGILLCALAMAILVLPVRRSAWADGLGLAAAVLCGSGSPIYGAAGIAGLVIMDAASGPFVGRMRVPRRRLRPAASSLGFSWIQHARAFGARVVLPFVPAAAVLFMTALFIRNNTFAADAAAAAARFGGAAAAGAILAAAAAISAKRRPPWVWSRSLPVSARMRVVADALFLGALGLAFLPFLAMIAPGSIPFVAALLPFSALRAAASLRPFPDSPRSPIPALALENAFLAAALGLSGWTAVLFAVASPLALVLAEKREKTFKAGRWLELRYRAAGDPFTGSPS